mgnify:CR=1 FL=1
MSLANIYTELDDMNSAIKAEDLFKEALEEYNKIYDKRPVITSCSTIKCHRKPFVIQY